MVVLVMAKMQRWLMIAMTSSACACILVLRTSSASTTWTRMASSRRRHFGRHRLSLRGGLAWGGQSPYYDKVISAALPKDMICFQKACCEANKMLAACLTSFHGHMRLVLRRWIFALACWPHVMTSCLACPKSWDTSCKLCKPGLRIEGFGWRHVCHWASRPRLLETWANPSRAGKELVQLNAKARTTFIAH